MTPQFRRLAATLCLALAGLAPLGAQDYKTSFSGIRVDRGHSPSTFHGGVSVDPASGGLNVSIPLGPGIGQRGLHFTPTLHGRWSPQWQGEADPIMSSGGLDQDIYLHAYNVIKGKKAGGFDPMCGGLQLVMVDDTSLGNNSKYYTPPASEDDTVATIAFPDGARESLRTEVPVAGAVPTGAEAAAILQKFGYAGWSVSLDQHQAFQETSGQPPIPSFIHLASEGDLMIGIVNPSLGAAGTPTWLFDTARQGVPVDLAFGYQGPAPYAYSYYAPPKVLVVRGEIAYEYSFATGYYTGLQVVAQSAPPPSPYLPMQPSSTNRVLVGGEYHLTKMINRYGDAIEFVEGANGTTATWKGGDGATGASILVGPTAIQYSGGNEAFNFQISGPTDVTFLPTEGQDFWPAKPILQRDYQYGTVTNVGTGEVIAFHYQNLSAPIFPNVAVADALSTVTTLDKVTFPGRTVSAQWNQFPFCYETDTAFLHSMAAGPDQLMTTALLPHWGGGVVKLTETDQKTLVDRSELHTRVVPQVNLAGYGGGGPKWTSTDFYDAIAHPDGSVTVMVYVKPLSPDHYFWDYPNDTAHMQRLAYLKHQAQSVWSYPAPAPGASNAPADLVASATSDVLAHLSSPTTSLAAKVVFSDRWDLHGLANPTDSFTESAEPHPTRTRTWDAEKGTVTFEETSGWDAVNRGYTTTITQVATDISSLVTTDYLAVDFPGSATVLSAPSGLLHKSTTARTLGSLQNQWFWGRVLNEATTVNTDATGGLAPSQTLPFAAAPLAKAYEDQFNRVTSISHGSSGDYLTTAGFTFGTSGVAQAQMTQALLSGTLPAGTALTNSGLVGAGYHYDANGFMDQINPKGAAWNYIQAQDALGLVQSQTDPNGKVTTFTWDDGGRLTRIHPPDGLVDTVITPDADNLGMTMTRGAQASRYRFNGFGELALEQRSLDGGSTWSSHKAYAYDPAGRRLGETVWLVGPGDETEWIKPNLAGQALVTVITVPGFWYTECLEEDANGNCVGRRVTLWEPPEYGSQTIAGLYPGTATSYDGQGRVVQVRAPKDPSDANDLALVTSTAYAGPLGSGKSSRTVTTGVAATTFTSDALGRLLSVKDALNQTTTYGYDPVGRIKKVTQTDASGTSQVRSWVYTKTGWVTSMVQPESGTTAYSSFTVTGKPRSTTYGYGSAAPRTTTTTFDPLDRVTRLTSGDGSVDQAFTWDGGTAANLSNGKLLYGRDKGVELNYTYGGLGGALSTLSTKVWSGGAVNSGTAQTFAQSFNVDTYGNRSGGNTSHGAWTQSYDAARGLPSVLKLGATSVATASYDPTAWFLSQIAFGNGVKTTFGYMVDQARLKQMTHLPVSGGAFAAWTYQYDDRGNLATETDTTSGKQDKYGYDLLNRLTFVDANALMSGVWREYQQSFSYDAFGNRSYGSTARVVNWDATQSPAKANLAYDSLPAQTQNGLDFRGSAYPELAVLATNNRLPAKTASGALTGAAYDPYGNLSAVWTKVGDSSTQLGLTYDALGRVTQLTRPGNLIETYAYTPEGLRTSIQTYNGSTLTGTAFNVYDDTRHLVAEYTQAPAGALTWKKDILYIGGKEAAEWDATGMHITQDDHLGSPRFMTNASGTLESTQKFLPFGESIADAGNVAKFAKGFTNHEQTDPSGLIYMQARFYLPWVGRFGSPDPARDQHFEQTQSWNIYSYVQNAPTMHFDPNGMELVKVEFKNIPVTIDNQKTTGTEVYFDRKFVAGLTALVREAAKQGYSARITSSFRSKEVQQNLAKTNKNAAPASKTSYHEAGLAVDIYFTKETTKKDKDGKETKETQNVTPTSDSDLVKAAKGGGLSWGGDWNTNPESWHFENHDSDNKESLATDNSKQWSDKKSDIKTETIDAKPPEEKKKEQK